jgi:hypothetical protein
MLCGQPTAAFGTLRSLPPGPLVELLSEVLRDTEVMTLRLLSRAFRALIETDVAAAMLIQSVRQNSQPAGQATTFAAALPKSLRGALISSPALTVFRTVSVMKLQRARSFVACIAADSGALATRLVNYATNFNDATESHRRVAAVPKADPLTHMMYSLQTAQRVRTSPLNAGDVTEEGPAPPRNDDTGAVFTLTLKSTTSLREIAAIGKILLRDLSHLAFFNPDTSTVALTRCAVAIADSTGLRLTFLALDTGAGAIRDGVKAIIAFRCDDSIGMDRRLLQASLETIVARGSGATTGGCHVSLIGERFVAKETMVNDPSFQPRALAPLKNATALTAPFRIASLHLVDVIIDHGDVVSIVQSLGGGLRHLRLFLLGALSSDGWNPSLVVTIAQHCPQLESLELARLNSDGTAFHLAPGFFYGKASEDIAAPCLPSTLTTVLFDAVLWAPSFIAGLLVSLAPNATARPVFKRLTLRTVMDETAMTAIVRGCTSLETFHWHGIFRDNAAGTPTPQLGVVDILCSADSSASSTSAARLCLREVLLSCSISQLHIKAILERFPRLQRLTIPPSAKFDQSGQSIGNTLRAKGFVLDDREDVDDDVMVGAQKKAVWVRSAA